MKTIPLGSLARDTITGYTGIVVARTEWLNGCHRISIQSRELKDGIPVEIGCFDIQQIEVLEKKPAKAAQPIGGPKPSPTRQPDPAR